MKSHSLHRIAFGRLLDAWLMHSIVMSLIGQEVGLCPGKSMLHGCSSLWKPIKLPGFHFAWRQRNAHEAKKSHLRTTWTRLKGHATCLHSVQLKRETWRTPLKQNCSIHQRRWIHYVRSVLSISWVINTYLNLFFQGQLIWSARCMILIFWTQSCHCFW